MPAFPHAPDLRAPRLSIRSVLFGFTVLACLHAPDLPALTAPAPVREWIERDRPLPAVCEALLATAVRPADAQTWADLAAALFRSGDFEGAERAARRALTINSGNADAFVALGRALATQGAGKDARTQYQSALTHSPQHPAALRLLAAALDLNDERPRVLELARAYLALERSGPPVFAEHLQGAVKLIEALGDTRVNVSPPEAERPDRVVAPLALAEGLRVELQQPNGKPFSCLLDTGEESLTLTAATAEALGAKPVGALLNATATGLAEMRTVLVPELRMGAWKLSNVLASIGQHDIAGPALFGGYRVKLDWVRRELTLTRQPREAKAGPESDPGDLALPAGFRAFRFRRLGGIVCVPLEAPEGPAALRARPAWGILDSGCEPSAVLFPRFFDALKSTPGGAPLALPVPNALEGAAETRADGVTLVVPNVRLSFLGQTRNASMAYVSAEVAAINRVVEAELDAILGWPLIYGSFKSLELDFERCVLVVEPRR